VASATPGLRFPSQWENAENGGKGNMELENVGHGVPMKQSPGKQYVFQQW